MESLLISLLLFFFVQPSFSVHVCKPKFCSENKIPIRFPFWLGKHKDRCGYPGFQLSCNKQNQTVLILPQSGEFVVKWINYTSQTIYIDDPLSCLPRRFLSFNVTGTPFRHIRGKKYTFFNCSLSPPSCRLMPNVSVPLQLLSEMVALGLTWSEPRCRSCELQKMCCGFNSDTGLETGCSSPSGQKMYCGFNSDTGLETGCSSPSGRDNYFGPSATNGIIIGLVISALVCLIGFACYASGKVGFFDQRRRPNNELPTAEINPPNPSITVPGLDAPTIESYPKMVIGESFRLPNSTDGTCPICLSEYQPKETLKSIPECNHYFHAGCLDEWLKLNGTCPLCRNPPESTSTTLAHPCLPHFPHEG